MWTALLAVALSAQAAPSGGGCWSAVPLDGKSARLAVIHSPERNFGFDFGAKYFSDAKDLGVVVTNGTFYTTGSRDLKPLGRLIRDGREVYAPPEPRFKTSDGRLVDLGQRWGIGVDADGKALAVRDEDAGVMRAFVGGGIILLKDGQDLVESNRAVSGRYGASVPDAELDGRAARVAVGARADGALLVVFVPRGRDSATASDVRKMMSELGARDAVLYDGGHAAGFSAGLPGQDKDFYDPPDPVEDLNPTHLVFAGCE